MRRFALAFVFALTGCSVTAARDTLPSAFESAAAGVARVASVQIHASTLVLPLGQSAALSVVARDRGGRLIAGAFDRPIVLRSSSSLVLSSYRVINAHDAGALRVSWAPGASGASGTISAFAGGLPVTAAIAPSSGFTYYDAGDDPATDVTGFQIAASPDGKIFYGTLGPQTCTNNVCASAQGAIGELNPKTGKTRQIALPSEVLGLLFASDGGLWIAGGEGHLLYRMAPGPLSTPAAIVVPTPPPSVTDWGARLFAQDGSGNVWFGDANGHRLMRIPVAGPYSETSIVVYGTPKGPAGTPRAPTYAGGLAYGSDGNLYVADYNNGVLDRVDPSSGRTTMQIALPQQRVLGSSASAHPRFAVLGANGIDVSMLGTSTTGRGNGAIDEYVSGTTVRPLKLTAVPAGAIPDSLSVSGSSLYYADVFVHALGYVDESTGRSRLIPVEPFTSKLRYSPNGVAAMADGTAWFTCQDHTSPLQPLCIGHTVYLDRWSLFPGPSFTVGTKPLSSQIVGIMESPARDSGPFTARADQRSICTVSKVTDHNFVVTGKSRGHCTITVTDAKNRHAQVSATVVASH